ncbi:MAG: hypothetical protein JSR61_06070 [Proteobacteria bacterium]|nr:hypothetical protein [Pseudomonadota bacterium]
MKALLVIAAIIDVALAVLLVAVSGFLFGGGPQSVNAGPGVALLYGGAVVACLAAPVAGFMLNRRGKGPLGVVVSFLPPAGFAIALTLPPSY